ncbi:YbfB/YjiJ family MFS transporter [Acidovorax temperans]|uniref:YbfB/YjiJ family MFS transporter n=1 Tax=Acidovorax temperans TaxID=80878 RepID=UPI0030CC9619
MHAPLAIKQPARWRVIVAGICALILTVGLARFAYTPMLPIMREQAGLTHWAAGWLATVNYAGYMAGTLLAASINDLGRKYLIYRCGLVIAVVSTAAMGWTDSVPVWSVLRFVAGFSSTAGLLLASGLVLNWLIRQGHRPQLGLHFVGLGLGIAVSGVAVAALVQGLSWDRQWLGLGLLGIVFFGPAWLWMPPPVAVQPAAAQAASTSTTPPRRWMWLLIAAYFCAGFGFAMGATYTVAILVKLPVLADKGGWVWVIVGLAAAPSCFLWDRVADAVGQIRALMAAFVLQMVSVLMPIATDNAWFNVGGAMLFGATFVGIVSLTLTLIGRCFPANPAKAMARMTLSYGVAQIIAPAMAGYIATASGSYHGALVVTALVMGCGVVALQALTHEEQRAAQAAGAR